MKFPRNNRVSAFTLAEVIVVMAISSLVVISGYLAYQVIMMQMGLYKKNTELVMQAHQFNENFSKDLFLGNFAIRFDNTIKIVSDDTVTYSFNQGFILRKNNSVIDTFLIQVGELSSYLHGTETDSGNVDYVRLELSLANDIFPLYFAKRYSSYDFAVMDELISSE